MPALTQSRINRKQGYAGRYPSLGSSLGLGAVNKPKDIAFRYIELIVSVCQALEYINIGEWYWQIIRGTSRRHKPYTLRELELDEAFTIELFGINYKTIEGLPMVD